MAIRGNEAKDKLVKALVKIFPGAFLQDAKTVRIPVKEASGEVVEIRITMTACKDTLGGAAAPDPAITDIAAFCEKPTEEQIAKVKALLESIGIQ